MQTAIALFTAAFLEVFGLGLIRIGLRSRWLWIAAGAIVLFAYGMVVNQGRLDFNRLMGAYIAVFFAVSQIVAFGLFRNMPDSRIFAGGLLIAAGGALMML
jgi:drug/metabolite transporter superfamily protein YnfA